MKAKKFEQQFDEGVDVTASLDLSKAKRVLQEQKRVNVDFPTWMIDSLDREASKLGVTSQTLITDCLVTPTLLASRSSESTIEAGKIDIYPFLLLQHAPGFRQIQRSRDVDAVVKLLLELFSFHTVPPLLCVHDARISIGQGTHGK